MYILFNFKQKDNKYILYKNFINIFAETKLMFILNTFY